jgi:hypothetical protein
MPVTMIWPLSSSRQSRLPSDHMRTVLSLTASEMICSIASSSKRSSISMKQARVFYCQNCLKMWLFSWRLILIKCRHVFNCHHRLFSIFFCLFFSVWGRPDHYLQKIITDLWLEFRDRSTESSTQAEEILTGFRTVKLFDNELFEYEQYTAGLNFESQSCSNQTQQTPLPPVETIHCILQMLRK